ncbi:hypothetical protein GpartN1_g7738.t1 [Galdieria partita]|uniref:Uncharacterized protein n=1 Tax=Galdieria partita TaxID=83374 RepID=A0A9C7Q6Z4_9RHOD|nr:hypothetical protein GpartN1_g7738.t1 [Galdieria partita]
MQHTSFTSYPQLYRKYIQWIYHCKLFSEDTKARMVYLTRHGFRYGVPVSCSQPTSPTLPMEEAMKRGERTLEVLKSLQCSSVGTTERDCTGQVFPNDGDNETFEKLVLSKQLGFGLYEDFDLSSAPEKEEEKQWDWEQDELTRALLRRFVFNLVHFTALRHDRKTLGGVIRSNKLLHQGMKSPYVGMDKCMDNLNRELGTSFYSKVIKKRS